MHAARVPELDGLRGLAVLLIVVFHTMILLPVDPPPAYKALYSWMWTGVTIFFVLSGYLITQILMRTSGTRNYFLNFFLRRAFRIFPAYYATLIIIFLLVPFLSDEFAASATRQEFWLYAAYLQNWSFAFNGWSDWHGTAHFWSLAVEEQFYLLWPLVILLAGVRRVPVVCLTFIVMALITSLGVIVLGERLANVLMGGTKIFLHTSTITAMSAIAAGSFIASLDPGLLRRQGKWVAAAGLSGGLAALIAILGKSGFREFADTFLRAGIILMTAAFLGSLRAAIAPAWLRALFSGNALVRAGILSYSIYLVHYPLLILVREKSAPVLVAAVASHPVAASLVLVPLSITLCWLVALPLYHFVETPFMRLRTSVRENNVQTKEKPLTELMPTNT